MSTPQSTHKTTLALEATTQRVVIGVELSQNNKL